MIVAHSLRVQFITVGKLLQQETQTAGHIASTARKQSGEREKETGGVAEGIVALSSCSPFYTVLDCGPYDGATHI